MYTATAWVNGTTALNQTHLNNLETEYTQAVSSFNQDLFPGFVLFGLVASKDSVTASQLDVTAGVAYVLQSDGTTYRIAPTSSTQTTSVPSTVYRLYLQPDGTWYWSTSNTPQTGSLFICNLTTDGSGNILAITDKRNLNAALVPNSTGTVGVGIPANGGWGIDVLGSSVGFGIATPGTLTATPVAGSGLGTGVYQYVTTFVSFNGECTQSAAASCTTTGTNAKVNLSVIPTGPTGTLSRNIYRTVVGGSTFKLLVNIADNTTTTYSDTTADGSLGAQNPPVHPTMGAEMFKAHNGTLLAAIYGDGAFMCDTGQITTSGTGMLTATTTVNNATPLTAMLPSAPGGDQAVIRGFVTGDGAARSRIYIRGSDGYGGFAVGAGSSTTAHLYGQSTGWQIDEALTVTGAITSPASFTWDQGSIGASAATIVQVTPAGASVNNNWRLLYLGNDGFLSFNDQTNAVNILQLVPNGGINIPTGPVGNLGGQATAGSFGVPPIVASVINHSVAVTTSQNIISFTPSVAGLYRLSAYFFHGNTGTTNCSLGYTWTDSHGSQVSGNFIFANSAAYQIISALAIGQNNMIASLPVVVYSGTSAAILITFQDASGTPSDFVSAIIERVG